MKTASLAFILTLFLFPSILYAHGVRGRIGKGGIVVIAEYDTGEPMSYAKVVITAPDKKMPFQIGRTDRNGRFCFFPDTPGKWKVVISDGMGHQLQLIVPINKKMEISSKYYKKNTLLNGMSKFQRAIIGLSLIFGISGIFMGWKSRRQKF